MHVQSIMYPQHVFIEIYNLHNTWHLEQIVGLDFVPVMQNSVFLQIFQFMLSQYEFNIKN